MMVSLRLPLFVFWLAMTGPDCRVQINIIMTVISIVQIRTQLKPPSHCTVNGITLVASLRHSVFRDSRMLSIKNLHDIISATKMALTSSPSPSPFPVPLPSDLTGTNLTVWRLRGEICIFWTPSILVCMKKIVGVCEEGVWPQDFYRLNVVRVVGIRL